MPANASYSLLRLFHDYAYLLLLQLFFFLLLQFCHSLWIDSQSQLLFTYFLEESLIHSLDKKGVLQITTEQLSLFCCQRVVILWLNVFVVPSSSCQSIIQHTSISVCRSFFFLNFWLSLLLERLLRFPSFIELGVIENNPSSS